MKSAFVTGASQGLGLGFVKHLLGNGWRVFGTTRTLSADLLSHENLIWIEMDVTDDDSIDRAVARVRESTAELDLLINNAGVNKNTATDNHKELANDLVSLDRAVLRNMFDVNAIGPILILKKLLPFLTPHPAFVINISSCRASFHDAEGNEHGNYGYRASKIALNMLTACSLYDLPKNVRTFAVHPGSVRSFMNPAGKNLPEVQAEKIMAITAAWKEEWNGGFMNFDGAPYPL